MSRQKIYTEEGTLTKILLKRLDYEVFLLAYFIRTASSWTSKMNRKSGLSMDDKSTERKMDWEL